MMIDSDFVCAGSCALGLLLVVYRLMAVPVVRLLSKLEGAWATYGGDR